LRAEFEHFGGVFEKFENGKAEHSEKCLASLFGKSWKQTAKDLRSIGFLKLNVKARSYSIPFVYRTCLGIRQGRCSGVHN